MHTLTSDKTIFPPSVIELLVRVTIFVPATLTFCVIALAVIVFVVCVVVSGWVVTNFIYCT